ncbi:hypothetical protein ACIBG7_03970 [Nonomuraea sp. NPDC050328]
MPPSPPGTTTFAATPLLEHPICTASTAFSSPGGHPGRRPSPA